MPSELSSRLDPTPRRSARALRAATPAGRPVAETSGGIVAIEPTVLEAPQLTVRRARSELLKRVFDIVLSAIALMVLAPLLALIALTIALSTRTSPIFVQERVGRDARTFPCLKFKTMKALTPEDFEKLLAENDDLRAEWRRDQKLRKDPRVTALGRRLRSTNLDELPQLVNVLVGHMSLVGPRPIVVDEAGRYGAARTIVFAVRPGLTGLWQVSGRNQLPYEQRVALDQEYVLTRTNVGDAVLIARTIQQTFFALLGRHDQGAF